MSGVTQHRTQSESTRLAHALPAVVGGRYRPLRHLASGGAGSVYEAEHLHTGARVALKLLHGLHESSAASSARADAEARIASSIACEHVVRITDAGRADELGATPFVVMELLQGRTLEDEARLPMSPALVVEIMTQLARGLEQVHAAGVVHCDLKPENIFLTKRPDGSLLVKLIDFGIAKTIARSDSGPEQQRLVIGTPMYMAPEQAYGQREQIDERTDTWALGLIAFRLLSGRPYFPDDLLQRMLLRLLSTTLHLPSAVGCAVSPAFDTWFMRSCSRDIAPRFRSPREQVQALCEALEGVTSVSCSATGYERRSCLTVDLAVEGRCAATSRWSRSSARSELGERADDDGLTNGRVSGIVRKAHKTPRARVWLAALLQVVVAMFWLTLGGRPRAGSESIARAVASSAQERHPCIETRMQTAGTTSTSPDNVRTAAPRRRSRSLRC